MRIIHISGQDFLLDCICGQREGRVRIGCWSIYMRWTREDRRRKAMGCTKMRVSMRWGWVSVGHGVSQKVTCENQKLERVWGLKTSFRKSSVLQGLVKSTGIGTVPCEESGRPTRERSAVSGTERSPVRWDLEKTAFKLSVTGLLTVQGQQSHWEQSHQRLEAAVRLQWVEQ